MLAGPVDSRAPIPVEGVVWRSCRFRPSPADVLAHDGARVALPADLRGAVDKRRAEFLAGRICATLALRALGVQAQIGRLGRAPVWPAGIRGSISHAGDRAMAVASDRHAMLGLDCEMLIAPGMLDDVASLVLAPDEWREGPAGLDAASFCTLAFSAKEAAYKALSSRLTDIPEFREARVSGIGADRLMVHLRGWDIPVRHVFEAGFCITLACLP